MKKVFKYELGWDGVCNLQLPLASEILYFNVQNDIPMLWVLVNPEVTAKVTRSFIIYGTGHTISVDHSDKISHIGSCLHRNGALVWHLFEVSSKR